MRDPALGQRFGIAVAPAAGFLLGGMMGALLTRGLGIWSVLASVIGGVIGLTLGAFWAEQASKPVGERRRGDGNNRANR